MLELALPLGEGAQMKNKRSGQVLVLLAVSSAQCYYT